MVRHVSEDRPRHHLKYLIRVIRVVACSDKLKILIELQTRRLAIFVGSDIGGNDRPERNTSGKKVHGIDRSIAARKWVVTRKHSKY